MSLVGYAASDDSSDEDDNNTPSSNDKTPNTNAVLNAKSEPQRDVEILHPLSSNGIKSDKVFVDKTEEETSVEDLFKVLPKPQQKKEANEEIAEEDLEDMVKPKSSQKTTLPKPLPLLKNSHVKITIPALDSDSDEEEVVVKKKMKISAGKNRLLDILPPPKHMSVKQTNRAFIPYTLNKKSDTQADAKYKTPAPSSQASRKPTGRKTNILGMNGYNSADDDDDDDDDNVGGSNFFSLDSKPKQSALPLATSTISGVTSTISSSSLSVLSSPWQPQQTFVSAYAAPVSAATATAAVPPTNYADYYQHSEEYDQPDQGGATVADDDDGEIESPPLNIDTLLQDEQFLRLQGKNQRGKEQIQLTNVNADDFIDKTMLTKTLTQEMPKHSHKKDKDAPSKKSRNKHQITYLAYQAKERELELKNQWSQNRMTKRQTQAKYGF
ncbi:proline-rich protein PRCC-like [Argonauta hians]